jgi:hypothetical protein
VKQDRHAAKQFIYKRVYLSRVSHNLRDAIQYVGDPLNFLND